MVITVVLVFVVKVIIIAITTISKLSFFNKIIHIDAIYNYTASSQAWFNTGKNHTIYLHLFRQFVCYPKYGNKQSFATSHRQLLSQKCNNY